MGRHSGDQDVFIRSMATRGHLGGLARTTGDVALVLDAAGKDVVIIETVGVGQDEIDIARTADITIVVLVPGTGDEVQALKAGIMEIADIFVVNKADREGADHLVQAIAANLALQPDAPDGWRPPIIKTVATTGEGIGDLWAAIGRFRSRAVTGGERRRARFEHHFRALLGQYVLRRLGRNLPAGELDRIVDGIAAREVDPYTAADSLIATALAPR
jgi:LAO/AO transport system kinase